MLDGGQLGFGLRPAPAPLAHCGAATIKHLDQRVVALMGGSPQHDPYPERQGLRAGGLTEQGFEEELLWS